jgi:hypothetical protein
MQRKDTLTLQIDQTSKLLRFFASLGGLGPSFCDSPALGCMQTDDVCPVDDPELTVCPTEVSLEEE